MPSLTAWTEPRVLIQNIGDELSVNDEVAAELNKVDKPLVVVCIAGAYRTGKSYLMNKLAGRQSGFALGSTVESKTKGIWAWVVDHPLDPSKALLLLDTEGLEDAFRGNDTYDMWICCLAVLLSSVFVYNTVGKIENATVDKLHFVTEMSNHIRAHNQDKTDDNFDEFFPSFILAVRDFVLQPIIDGQTVTSDEYMEQMLLSLKRSKKLSKQEEERLKIKMKLRSYFKQRKCFFFQRPVATDAQLRMVDTLPESELKPKFVEQVAAFCKHIFQSAPVKKLDHVQQANGRILVHLARQYVSAIRAGVVPCVEAAVDMVARTENNRAIDDAVHFYCTKIRELLNFPVESNHLTDTHQACYKQAVDIFLKKAFLDKGNEYHNMLQDRLQQEYVRIVHEDSAASVAKCQRILAQVFSKIDEQSRLGAYACSGGYKKYLDHLEEAKTAYHNTPDKGVKSEEALQAVLNQRSNEQLAIMKSDEALTDAEKHIEDERIKQEEANKQIELQQKEIEEVQRHQSTLVESHKEHMKQLQATFEEKMKEQDAQFEELIQKRLAEQERLMKEQFEREAAALQAQIDQMRRKKKRGFLGSICGALGSVLSFIPTPWTRAAGFGLLGASQHL